MKVWYIGKKFIYLSRGVNTLISNPSIKGGILLPKLITVNKAIEEIKRLQEYIDLVNSYETDTLERVIIKEYAYTNSIAKVTKMLVDQGYMKNGSPINTKDVSEIIKSRSSDKLHRLIRSGYLQRTKHNRKI